MLPKVATEKQKKIFAYAMAHPYSILAVDARLGKAQPIDSIVYGPDGPREIGSLVPGDMVFGPDGKAHKVTGIFPQGIKRVYRTTFSDGSNTLCCGEHLWSIKTGNDRARGSPPRVLDTLYIRNIIKSKTTSGRAFIEITKPINFNPQELLIPPYTMGVLIGDGGLTGGVQFTNGSAHIFERVKKDISGKGIIIKRYTGSGRSTKITLTTKPGKKNPWVGEIRDLGLKALSKKKFIPNKYKINSVKNRVELLRGLLDTDGYVAKDGTTQFTSASERLCDDVKWIVQSLGGVARKTYKLSRCQTGSFDSWTLTISIPTGITPITKPEKLKRYAPKKKFKASRKFISIKYAGRRKCVCISVDGQEYITDEFIVTHNSMCAIAIQQTLKNNCLVISPGYLTVNWVKEIKKWARKDAQITIFKKGSEIYEPVDSDFVVISFDLVQKAEHLFEWASMVIIDEVQHIKSLSAKRTQFIHRCIYENSVGRVHLLSGTILKNRVKEFYSPISIMYYSPDPRISKKVTPDFLDKFQDEITFADHFSFRKEFNVRIKNKWGGTYSMPIARWEGLRNKKELKKYLKGKYIRVRADASDLPPVSYRDILISDSNDLKLLDAFNQYFAGEGMSSVKSDIKVQAALKKVPFTIKYVEDLLDKVDCVLVYSDHVQVIEEISKHFKVKPITGKTTSTARAKMAVEFQAGKGTILCATIGSLKEGQDLFRSKDIVISDPCWVPGDLRQVINRIRGLGQKDPRTVHRILGSPQDEKIYRALEEKQKTIDLAVD